MNNTETEDQDEIKILAALKRIDVDCDENGVVYTRFGNIIDLKQLIKSVLFDLMFHNINGKLNSNTQSTQKDNENY